MAAMTTAKEHEVNHIPSYAGGDLPENECIAYEEGHDADLPSNGSVGKRDVDIEKHDAPSSTASVSDAHHDDVEKGKPVATATDEELPDPNVVDWDGPDDPENPLNWSPRKKWANIAVLSALTLLTPLASSMFAPGVPELLSDFHTDNQNLATFVVSVYILGFAMGPLIIAPLSELYGRVVVYNVCNVGFILWTVGCALATDMNMLIGFRFMAGAWGIAPITNGGGTIADIMKPEQRGGAMAIWAMGPLLGPVIGPVAGGYLAQAEGWRW